MCTLPPHLNLQTLSHPGYLLPRLQISAASIITKTPSSYHMNLSYNSFIDFPYTPESFSNPSLFNFFFTFKAISTCPLWSTLLSHLVPSDPLPLYLTVPPSRIVTIETGLLAHLLPNSGIPLLLTSIMLTPSLSKSFIKTHLFTSEILTYSSRKIILLSTRIYPKQALSHD